MPNSNNSINNTVGNSNNGGLNTLTVQNQDNSSSSSHARVNVTVASPTSGNPSTQYTTPGTNNFTFEINNAAGVTSSLELLSGSTPLWTMSPRGQQNLPLQPAFLAYINVGASPVHIATGSTTSDPAHQYLVGNQLQPDGLTPAPLYAVRYDTRNAFTATAAPGLPTGYYTIPESGIYYFIGSLDLNNVASTDLDAQLSLAVATSAANLNSGFLLFQVNIDIFRPAALSLGATQVSFQTSGYNLYTKGQVVGMRLFVTGQQSPAVGNHIEIFNNSPGTQFFNFLAGHRVA